jgi:uncharacterized protein
MNSDQLLSPRLNIPLVLSIVCFTISACADIQPASDMYINTRAEYDEAAKELHKSAEAGDSSAQNALGLLYYKGKGVSRDTRQAKQWFEKAAEQGHAGAQVNLGTLYLHGDGAPQSAHMALFWFSRAAEQGHALALAKLGRMYERGRAVSRDIIQARMWYNLSAALGEKRAAEARDALANQMTSAQIAEADRLARGWKPKTN